MSEWNYKRWLLTSVILAALVWLVAFLLTTKPVQLWVLRRAVGFEEVTFERGHLKWGGAYLQDIELETAGIRLQARETEATFSIWKALLGRRDAIGDLKFKEAHLRDVDPTAKPWPGRVLSTLEDWRPRKDLLRFDSLALKGVWERLDGTEVALDLKGEELDFSDRGELQVLVAPIPESSNEEAEAPRWRSSGALSWSRAGGSLFLLAEGNATLFSETGISSGVNQFSSYLRLSDDEQSLDGKWMNADRTVFEGKLSRDSADLPFSGLGELAVNQRDLGAFWMPLQVFNIKSTASVSTRWRPEQGNGSCNLRLDGNASSFLFRHLGQVSLGLGSSFRFDLDGIVSEDLHFKVTTGRGETLRFSQSGKLRIPEFTGDAAKVSLTAKGMRLDWLSSFVPWKMDASWKLSDFSLEAGSEGSGWRLAVAPVEVSGGAIPMAKATKLVAEITDANTTERTLELEVEGSVERGLLAELLPQEGPLGAFDEEDARGVFAGEIVLSGKGMALRRGEVSLASGEGARQLSLRSEGELKLDASQPDFIDSDARGELFTVKGNRLPVDGLLRSQGGGEAQGDVDAFSGKISRDDRGWIFRSDEAVEIANARVVRRKVNYGEGLRAKADLEVILDREGGLRINADKLSLEGDERTSFTGSLSLLAKPSDSGHLFATKLESTSLKVDLTTLTWLGFSEFPDLEAGSLNIGKLKASFGDDFSFELDGALEDFRVVDEAPMTGGLQATVRSQPDGFSTWARLSLIRENRESDATLDIFLPSDGNASRRKLSLSGEEFHLDELLAFATTIPAPADREALLTGQRFPGWARGTWELAFDVLLVKGLPPFKEVKAKLFLQPRDLLLAYAEGQWLDGVVSADGSLSLGSPDELGVRLQNFNARATQALLQNLTKRIKGPVDAQLSGWAEGTGWNDALKGFSGQVKVTARNGLLRLGPMAEEGVGEDPSQDPWSLIRLGKLLEGKASVSDSRKTLLQKMDSALGDVSYELVQVIGRRAPDGNFSVTELSVLGPAFKVSGKGKVTSFPEGEGGGTLNLNLSVGARGELVEILNELGVLAPVKAEGEYRMLKKDPLVVQGTMEKPDFSNFWALLAEGLGMGGFDPPEPN